MNEPGPSRRTTTRAAGIKRSIGTADVDKEISASKRPALSSAFSNHLSQSSISRQLLAAQSQVTELQNKLLEKNGEIERLQVDRRWLAEKEEEERTAREKETAEYHEERKHNAEELSELRHRFSELENDYAELQDSSSTLAHNLQNEVAALHSELASETQEAALLESQLDEVQSLAAARLERIAELEAQVEDLQQNDRSDASTAGRSSGDTTENWKIIREELHRQSGYLRTLEAANARLNGEAEKLRQRAEVVEVLREEKHDLERKVRGVDDLRRRVGELEGELAAEKIKRSAESAKVAEPDTPGKTPVTITHQLTSLRTAHAILLDEQGQLKASLRQREAELSEAHEQQGRTLDEVTALKAGIKQARDASERRERDLALMEREVGFLKALVASYTAEEASVEKPDDDQAKAQLKLEQRVAHLEELLGQYKTANAALEKDVEKMVRDGGPVAAKKQEQWEDLIRQAEEATTAKSALETAFREAEAEADKHAERAEKLEQTLFELRGEIGAGHHVPPGMRVLSLRQNPAQEWADTRKEVLDRLKNENEALLRRLHELEESGAHVGNASSDAQTETFVPRESWEVVCHEKKELEEVVRQKEKRLLRLQQVFTAKSSEFREAIAAILGLKLAFYPNGQVRVTSQYDLSASFVFQPTLKTEGARMQLIGQGEGGPQDLPQLIHYWVEQEMCIPGFLASVTLECYEKSKGEMGLAAAGS